MIAISTTLRRLGRRSNEPPLPTTSPLPPTQTPSQGYDTDIALSYPFHIQDPPTTDYNGTWNK